MKGRSVIDVGDKEVLREVAGVGKSQVVWWRQWSHRVAGLQAGRPRARTQRGVNNACCGVGYCLTHHLPLSRTAATLHGAL